MKALRTFWQIVDYQTVAVTALAVVSTYLCRVYNLAADMPSVIVTIAVIFPIVFSLNAAYRRREEALNYFGSIKATCLALYFAHGHWVPSQSHEHQARARRLLDAVLTTLKDFFTAEAEKRGELLRRMYSLFARLSASHEELRAAGVPPNEISQASNYLRSLMTDFERMRNILEYRTPVLLRVHSQVFLNAFPIVFGPYFAYLADKYVPFIGYLVAVVYSMVIVSLDNIQEHLENPYDGCCEDDVRLDAVEIHERIGSDIGLSDGE